MHERVEFDGQYYRVRVGERSVMEGVFTTQLRAEKALKTHMKGVAKTQARRLAKKVKNAKKTEC